MSSLIDGQLLWENGAGTVSQLNWESITYKTYYQGQAGQLLFSFFDGDVFSNKSNIQLGDKIVFKLKGKSIFCGYVFSVGVSDSLYSVVCYDQLRYLLNKDSMIFSGTSLGGIVKKIASVNGLKLGQVSDTGYTIPFLPCEAMSYLQMISEAQNLTYKNAGKRYALYDHAGSLTLTGVGENTLDVIIDGGSSLCSFTKSTSIEEGVYNEVKIMQYPLLKAENRSFTLKEEAKIKQWGKLRYFAQGGAKLNSAQIKEQAKAILEANSTPKSAINLKALGDIKCLAGFRPYIKFPDGKDEGYYLIESAQHLFNAKQGHVMYLSCVK